MSRYTTPSDLSGSDVRRPILRRSTRPLAVSLGLTGALLLSACSSDADNSSGSSGSARKNTPAATEELSNEDVVAALDQISEYWSGQAAALGITDYETIPHERLQPLGGVPFECDGAPVADSDVEDNAIALSCEEGYGVMWDPAMLDDLAKKYGRAGAIEVMAHEWGHIIDYQLNLNLGGVISEQFADCMAGVWAADATEQQLPPFETAQALDGTIAAVAEFRDTPGDSAESEDAHGSAFDRVRAFQEGFDRGARFCVTYRDVPPALTQIEFLDKADESTGGNLSFDETVELDKSNLASFMEDNPDPFPPTDVEFRSMSESDAQDFHHQIGDAATTVVLATDTAAAAQEAAGEDPSSEGAYLQQACWAGAYFGWIWNGNSQDSELSPGDLDEAIAAFVALTDESSAGFVFEQVSQMRTGFVQGISACTNPG